MYILSSCKWLLVYSECLQTRIDYFVTNVKAFKYLSHFKDKAVISYGHSAVICKYVCAHFLNADIFVHPVCKDIP